jgi:hypothetical protein
MSKHKAQSWQQTDWQNLEIGSTRELSQTSAGKNIDKISGQLTQRIEPNPVVSLCKKAGNQNESTAHVRSRMHTKFCNQASVNIIH